MEVLHPRCAGLDVHKDSVVACVRVVEDGGVRQEVRTFGTTTSALCGLADWLDQERCAHVVMEATGIYWKPVWHVLEGHVELMLANAAHVKSVPGRKTDVNDATWLSDLLAHGLVRGSFVPERPIQELRGLTRARKQFVRQRSEHVQRIQKVLQDANLKLDSVVTDIMGRSGRRMLDAIVAGETDPGKLANLGDARLKTPRKKIAEALRGTVTAHHRFMLGLFLEQVDTTNATIAKLEEELGVLLEPFHEAVELVKTVPGIGETAAAAIMSEIGVDMTRFPADGNLVSWAGLCPRNDESAGKRRSTRIRKGDPWLKTVLVNCAWAAVRTKNSYERALFFRLKSRRGPNKAIIAVAASMLTAIYHILKNRVPYRDLGPDHLDQVDAQRRAARLVHRLQRLGYEVELKPVA